MFLQKSYKRIWGKKLQEGAGKDHRTDQLNKQKKRHLKLKALRREPNESFKNYKVNQHSCQKIKTSNFPQIPILLNHDCCSSHLDTPQEHIIHDQDRCQSESKPGLTCLSAPVELNMHFSDLMFGCHNALLCLI